MAETPYRDITGEGDQSDDRKMENFQQIQSKIELIEQFLLADGKADSAKRCFLLSRRFKNAGNLKRQKIAFVSNGKKLIKRRKIITGSSTFISME